MSASGAGDDRAREADKAGSLGVLYVLAHSRSGSTLLARTLGQLPQAVSVGEVRYLWRRGLVENQPCGCGERFHDCPFWSEIVRHAYGPLTLADAERMAEIVRAADRVWRMPLVGGTPDGPPGRRVQAALDVATPLYRAIQAVTGASVIVDSSKSPSYAWLLGRSAELRPALTHLVRDLRGVAFSRVRRVARGELASRSQAVLLARTAIEWGAVNALGERLGGRLPYLMVRYEDFVDAPRETVRRIAALAGLPESGLDFVQPGGVTLPGDHTVSGNQMRFENGWIPLRADDEWRSRLTRGDVLLVGWLGRPWLNRYGYA